MSTNKSVPPKTAVMGLDGSETSRHALLWLLAHHSLADQIEVVSTFTVSALAAPYGLRAAVPNLGEIYRESAQARADLALRGIEDSRIESVRIFESRAGTGLVEAAKSASLLVLGSSGHSALGGAFLGSVSSKCIRNSTVPVLVVPPSAALRGELMKVVVGVDGSPNGQAALQWAIDHVDADGVVELVAAFSPLEIPEGTLAKNREATVELVQLSIDRCENGRGVRTVSTITAGDPRNVIAQSAEQADLLVIGQRGRRSVAHLLLGSTATSLAHHVTVPTVVVPDPGP